MLCYAVMNTNYTLRFNLVSTPDGSVFSNKRNIALLVIIIDRSLKGQSKPTFQFPRRETGGLKVEN